MHARRESISGNEEREGHDFLMSARTEGIAKRRTLLKGDDEEHTERYETDIPLGTADGVMNSWLLFAEEAGKGGAIAARDAACSFVG